MAIEGMMDRIGRKLGVDPAEVRLRNIIPTKELPWVNAVGVRYDTGSYEECLRLAMERIGYSEFRKQPRVPGPDGKYRGFGICCFTKFFGTGPPDGRGPGLTRCLVSDAALFELNPTGLGT